MKMNRTISVLLAGFLLALPLRSLAEGYVIVKWQDMLKKATTEMMTESQYKVLEKTIAMEGRYFPQAVQLAAKEWREDELNKGTPFAGSRLTARKIVGTPERFSNQEKAQQKLTAIEDLESKKQFRAREKELANKGQKKSKEELAREYEKEGALSSAAQLVQTKLEELISAKTANPAGGGGAAPAGKPVDNAAAKEAGLKAL